MSHVKHINPKENNGIVRIPTEDWEILYDIGANYNLAVQQVFEILITSKGGFTTPINRVDAELKIKLHRLRHAEIK